METIKLIIIAGYLITSFLFFFLAIKSSNPYRGNGSDHTRIIFIFISAALLSLLLIRGFNLNYWFTDLLRITAMEHGWYQNRHIIQSLAIIGLIVFIPIIVNLLKSKHAGISRQNIIRIYCTFFLTGVNIINLVSFHPVDWLFKLEFMDITLFQALELAGITCLILSLAFGYSVNTEKYFKNINQSKSRFID